jgi:hypothetical protein
MLISKEKKEKVSTGHNQSRKKQIASVVGFSVVLRESVAIDSFDRIFERRGKLGEQAW